MRWDYIQGPVSVTHLRHRDGREVVLFGDRHNAFYEDCDPTDKVVVNTEQFVLATCLTSPHHVRLCIEMGKPDPGAPARFEDRMDLLVYAFLRPTLPNLTTVWRENPEWVDDVIHSFVKILPEYDENTRLDDEAKAYITSILTWLRDGFGPTLHDVLTHFFEEEPVNRYMTRTHPDQVLTMSKRPFDDVLVSDLSHPTQLEYIVDFWTCLDDIFLELPWCNLIVDVESTKHHGDKFMVYLGDVHVHNISKYLTEEGFETVFASRADEDSQCVDISTWNEQPLWGQ